MTKGDASDLIAGLIDVGVDIAKGWDDVKGYADDVAHGFDDAYDDTKKAFGKGLYDVEHYKQTASKLYDDMFDPS
jgi:hypothetical protein